MSEFAPAAVVTGSTSGIGKAIAIRLLREGYNVVLNYAHDDERAAAAYAECERESGDALLVQADVSRAASAQALIGRCVDQFGRIDVLVNNAAVVADAPVLEMTEEQWDGVLAVNLKGAFFCAQTAARQMLRQDEGGMIVNIGASTGIRGRRDGINTCASKAGMIIMTHCLALELAPKVRVNTVIPGLTVTDETARRFGLRDHAVRQAREQAVPLGRLCQPDDVAGAVMMLLASDARFMTGQKIVIDGGQNMW